MTTPLAPATPVTILTGFLGAGKTTLILNLIPQLPKDYKLALLKNELGDLAIDSQLATSASISSVRELLNGCICCNLVGQLSDALRELRAERLPDRIIIETSGSAFPATLAMEVNRLAREANEFVLDGVISVIDVENWKGYEDTSVTAKLQARYTDLVIFNKWERVGERRFDDCLDRLGDLEVETPWVKSDIGNVKADVLLGIDGALARKLAESTINHDGSSHEHEPSGSHQSEVDVLSVRLQVDNDSSAGVDLGKLQTFLEHAPKDAVYRIKALLYANSTPKSSDGEPVGPAQSAGSAKSSRYILNWAFGRWTFTFTDAPAVAKENSINEPLLQMTVVLAKYEANNWKKRIENGGMIAVADDTRAEAKLQVDVMT
ncbi:MAG: hypothetical protein M1828_006731 [Chrysothrix sp. TS-e1954]|nr:MAG: hypothetical protein M1828_006731 [Chrysothrix sp. TS-e1954]